MSKYADLHIHSVFSDSTLSADDIFRLAKENEVDCVSVTDHDTLDFYQSAEVNYLSQKTSIDVIQGIEFSSVHKGKEVHLLGYFPDNFQISDKFLNVLDCIKQERKRRLFNMLEKLRDLNIHLDINEFTGFLGDSCPSRLQLAVFLIRQKVVPTIREAFNRYIGPGKPAYISRSHYQVERAVPLLKQEGALIFLAHPLTLGDDNYVTEIIKLGIDGLEVFYPSHNSSSISYYKGLAERYKLLVSGGSDAHGDYKKYTNIGKMKMDYQYAAKIKNSLVSSLK